MEQYQIIAEAYVKTREILHSSNDKRIQSRSTEVMQMLESWWEDKTPVENLRHSWKRHIMLYSKEHNLENMLSYLSLND